MLESKECKCFIYTTKEQEVKGKEAWVGLILSVRNLRSKCLIVMVCDLD